MARRKSDRSYSSRSLYSSSLNLSFGSDLDVVLDDRKIKSDPLENRNRRTIVVKRESGSFGFTLQSYGMRHRDSDEMELISYVDYVEIGGAAYKAGMRAGDVILSINGKSMENVDHAKLVEYIRNCDDTIRMVVLFEDVCKKIELHLRYLKLKEVLAAKLCELRSVADQETKILQKVGAFGGESISFPDAIDGTSLFGSIYFNDEMWKLTEKQIHRPNTFRSSSDLHCNNRSPNLITPGSPFQPSLSPSSLFSPGVVSLNTSLVETPSHSTLPSLDDVFWSSNFTYGSLPTRSHKKGIKSSPSIRSTASVRWNVDHPLISTTLIEEGDENHDIQAAAGVNRLERSISATVKESGTMGISSAASFEAQKPKNKISSSVPNLIKLKVSGSPFPPRRPKIQLLRMGVKQKALKDDTVDLHGHVGRDPRQYSKQMRQQISNYVITEELDRKSNDPQLLGLRQLCNDFRVSCFQQNLKQRRKSIEFLMNNGCLQPSAYGLNQECLCQKMNEYKVTDCFIGIKNVQKLVSPTSEPLVRRLPKLYHSEVESIEIICKSVGVESHQPASGMTGGLQGSNWNFLNSKSQEHVLDMPKEKPKSTDGVTYSDEMLLESQGGREFDVCDGFSESMTRNNLVEENEITRTLNFEQIPDEESYASLCINKENEVTRL